MLSYLSALRSHNRRFITTLTSASITAAAITFSASATLAEEPVLLDQIKQLKPVPEKVAEVRHAQEWNILIVPGPSSVVLSSSVRPSARIEQVSFNEVDKVAVEKNLVPPIEEPASAVRRNEQRAVTPESYREIYNSIPFSRAEYLANRDYRHEATMEILFGQLRPKTIVKTASPTTETRTSYTHQFFGRPGSFPTPVLNSPMMWSPWSW